MIESRVMRCRARVAAVPAAVALVVAVAGSASHLGCKGREDGPREAAAAESKSGAPASGTTDDDGALLARRDSLLASRVELRSKQAELAERRQAISAKGGDTSEIDRETEELTRRETSIAGEEKSLLDRLLSERQSMVSALAASKTGGGTPGREAAVAAREKDMARREQKLAERESQLAGREEGLASKWKDACAVPTTIVQTIDAKGTRYTRRDVEPLLARSRDEMNKKGLLRTDLPEPVRDLESEATGAMARGDYGQARFAAAQLLGTVRVIKVDKPFIAEKIRRLDAALKTRRLTPQVETLFREATQNVADGNFVGANRKLNRIHSAIN
jgi:hypothetical protein